jgi:hypothetical protein
MTIDMLHQLFRWNLQACFPRKGIHFERAVLFYSFDGWFNLANCRSNTTGVITGIGHHIPYFLVCHDSLRWCDGLRITGSHTKEKQERSSHARIGRKQSPKQFSSLSTSSFRGTSSEKQSKTAEKSWRKLINSTMRWSSHDDSSASSFFDENDSCWGRKGIDSVPSSSLGSSCDGHHHHQHNHLNQHHHQDLENSRKCLLLVLSREKFFTSFIPAFDSSIMRRWEQQLNMKMRNALHATPPLSSSTFQVTQRKETSNLNLQLWTMTKVTNVLLVVSIDRPKDCEDVIILNHFSGHGSDILISFFTGQVSSDSSSSLTSKVCWGSTSHFGYLWS